MPRDRGRRRLEIRTFTSILHGAERNGSSFASTYFVPISIHLGDFSFVLSVLNFKEECTPETCPQMTATEQWYCSIDTFPI